MRGTFIYTIGHGNKTMEEFIRELSAYNIQYLIDVRSKPFSKYYPQFNKESLILYFQVHKDIRYDWRGDKIGGLPPAEWNCYTTDGKIDYDKMAVNPIFVSGIESIVKANDMKLKVALMCSESDPQMCHRSKLIGKMLADRGIDVQHIMLNRRGDIITKSQQNIFTNIINENIDLFSMSLDIHLTSRNAYLERI